MRRIPHLLSIVVVVPATLFASLVCADGWRYCASLPDAVLEPPSDFNQTDNAWIIESDSVSYEDTGYAHFVGEVRAANRTQRINAKQLDYSQTDNTMQALGDVRYKQSDLALSAPQAEFDLAADKGHLTEVYYTMGNRHARGYAETVELEGKDLSHYTDTYYTTCPPDSDAWVLYAEQLSLDRHTGVGTARDITLEAGGLPLFYSPYFRFPLDDRRQSGFLAPGVASSSDDGFSLSLPYYFNIAPSLDATVTPQFMTQRGLLLKNELRTLSNRAESETHIDFIISDQVFDDDRLRLEFEQKGRFGNGWSSIVSAAYVSDIDYFDDLGDALSTTSTNHIERRADLTYRQTNWSVRGRTQYFQSLNPDLAPTSRPYQRMPQLTLNARWPQNSDPWNYKLWAEAVRFERDNTVTGSRFTARPSLSWKWESAAAFIKPKASLWHRQYRIDDPDNLDKDHLSSTIPVFSVDSGLFFERNIGWRNTTLMQTLEPRLFYLYVPMQDQSDIPVFDTNEPALSSAQMFRENRFTGYDRVGDANQITLALTSRFLDTQSGDEWVRASIGEIVYFRDREVTLPSRVIDNDSSSELLAELALRPTSHWFARAAVQWSRNDRTTSKNVVQLRYRRDNDRIANVSYRRRRGQLEQLDLSFRWKLRGQWHGIGRYNYSLHDNLPLQTIAGIEYDSCCWALKLLAETHIDDASSATDQLSDASIMLQIELKGLSHVGQKIDDFLATNILGYRPDEDAVQ
ncbi:MAG TPA: LPS assembly protein LptD [Chromatiaceae bacterium]|nr:LPS assembly protein LptD [Chromatiaceae bacterium]HIN81716.1 LPS-assembly protein LptD [Chromatiales bacterium]